MKIGIINAGNIGRTVAQTWQSAGHELLLAKAGSQEKLTNFADAMPHLQWAMLVRLLSMAAYHCFQSIGPILTRHLQKWEIWKVKL